MLKSWFGRRPAPNSERSVIGSGLQIRGPVSGMGELEIRGRVEGGIVHTGRLTVAAGAVCVGPVQTDDLDLAGEVRGDVHARGKLELMPGGRLYGDVVCGTLQIHPGAIFQGTTRMAGDSLPEPRPVLALPEPMVVEDPVPAVETPVPVVEDPQPVRPQQEIPSFSGGFGGATATRKIG